MALDQIIQVRKVSCEPIKNDNKWDPQFWRQKKSAWICNRHTEKLHLISFSPSDCCCSAQLHFSLLTFGRQEVYGLDFFLEPSSVIRQQNRIIYYDKNLINEQYFLRYKGKLIRMLPRIPSYLPSFLYYFNIIKDFFAALIVHDIPGVFFSMRQQWPECYYISNQLRCY